jgi:biopolymer transport protein ExbD
MAITVAGPRNGAIADINVTPMADVMIVLLIIFMVATPILAGAPVRLPTARHALEKQGRRLTLVVRANGGVELAGARIPGEALEQLLAERVGGGPAPALLLEADRTASFAEVARVLAACRRAGLAEVSLSAQLRPAS